MPYEIDISHSEAYFTGMTITENLNNFEFSVIIKNKNNIFLER